MKNLRKHGDHPFSIAVIHGGPGAAGQMKQVAVELSCTYGILEPLQTATSIDKQIQELYLTLKNHGTLPMILIGHSWGAWLVFLYTTRYPSSVKKILLVDSGPFEEHYVSQIQNTRVNRLNEKEKKQFDSLIDVLNNPGGSDKTKMFAQLGRLLFKTDSFNPLPYDDTEITYRFDIFQKVWSEAEKLRNTGTLLHKGKQIQCPVVAIHGEYDPHPFQGVKEPLSCVVKDFKCILLKKCGHYPWLEREAQSSFYDILFKELQ